ncbi:hypothetical protein LUZ61_012263 [Rhynchospora tenuis]|uniref:Uncharacterized protein n=1 Tax=Rhynchospora tenuis TaxID=198213 RepID=A0AAD6A2Q6_9POAL|nr:hypothetical protein LUZ61_012263 [Rhynchospora tenuis]
MMRSSEQEDHQSKLIYELCALLFAILRTSSPSHVRTNPRSRAAQVTPAAFASLLLGASLALMLCGSVTFVLGFLLMPWVVGFLVILYFLGVVSYISSRLERTVFWCSSGASFPKEMQEQFFSKQQID